MQQLAGVITESQLNETSTPKYSVKSSKKGFSVIKTSTGDEITSFDNEEKAKQHAEKLNKMKVIPKEKFKEGFQLNEDEKLSNHELLKSLKVTNMGHLYDDIINIPASDVNKVILGMKLIYDNFDCEPNGSVIQDIIVYLRQKSDNN